RLDGDADVELKDRLPGPHEVPGDSDAREAFVAVGSQAVLDAGIVDAGIEADHVRQVEGVLRPRNAAAAETHPRSRQAAQPVAEEGELELAEAVEPRAREPLGLEAQLLEQR